MSDIQTHDNHSLSERTLNAIAEQETKPTYTGMFESALVQDILRMEKKPIEDLLVGLLPRAALRAYAPVSKYHVGAVCLAKSGNIYLGSNIEVPGQVCGYAVHAEQAAFSNAFMHGEREIMATAMSAAPCGHCRQFMTEFSIPMDMSIIVKDFVPTPLASLLPEHFGPAHLGNTHGVSQTMNNKLKLFESFEAFDADPDLEHSALEAAELSYAPYTHSPSGAAISTKRSRIYKGSYIESVAFNPSLPPLQAALVSLIQAGESPDDIINCVIVELKDALITQEDSARAVLKGVQPGAHLNMVYARRIED